MFPIPNRTTIGILASAAKTPPSPVLGRNSAWLERKKPGENSRTKGSPRSIRVRFGGEPHSEGLRELNVLEIACLFFLYVTGDDDRYVACEMNDS